MRSILRLLAPFLVVALIAAVPRHVQTADYFGGYAGTKTVPADAAARLLSWGETDQSGSQELAAYGVKPILYSNPNLEEPGDPMYTSDESMFFHTCGGDRFKIRDARGFVVADPRSASLQRLWRQYVQQRSQGARYAAVFEDQAVRPSVYGVGDPCNYNANAWLANLNQAQRDLGYPIIYNGLSDFDNHGVAKEMALNATAIGGMMEQCYATSPPHSLAGGWQWTATENTEIRMARDRKYFFCYGNDLTPADQALNQRLYVYASFLLTYNLNTSVLWEYYKTPSNLHVMPESTLVALKPLQHSVNSVEQLRNRDGAYVREYLECYIDGRKQGACAVAVNPDEGATVQLSLHGYRRSARLEGSGIYDGGKISVTQGGVPGSLRPLSAVIAFK